MGRGGDDEPFEILYGRPRPLASRSPVFSVEIEIGISDRELLDETLQGYGLESGSSGLAGLFFSGDRIRSGSSVLGADFEQSGENSFLVRARIKVDDREQLISGVQESYAEYFFDDQWGPADLAEALAEGYAASSGLPSPDEMGIEIRSFRAQRI